MFSDRTHWNLKENRLSGKLAQLRASGRTILDLTHSNPTECGFNYYEHGIERALAQPASLIYRPDPRGIKIARQPTWANSQRHRIHLPAAILILPPATSEPYS